MTPSTDLLFLLVHYYNEDDVVQFIEKELGRQTVSWTAVVINNGSKDSAKLRERLSSFENAIYFDPGTNLGYLNGAAKGLEHFRKTNSSIPELVIVSNTDMEIESRNFLEELKNNFEASDIIGPSISTNNSSSDLNPFARERIPLRRMKFLQSIFSFYPIYFIYRLLSIAKSKFGIKSSSSNSTAEVYAIHGSFMVFRKTFFEKGGTLNFPCFLYEEELFIAEQARLRGMKTIHVSSLKVIHREHSTTGTIKSPKHLRFLRESIRFIISNYYNE